MRSLMDQLGQTGSVVEHNVRSNPGQVMIDQNFRSAISVFTRFCAIPELSVNNNTVSPRRMTPSVWTVMFFLHTPAVLTDHSREYTLSCTHVDLYCRYDSTIHTAPGPLTAHTAVAGSGKESTHRFHNDFSSKHGYQRRLLRHHVCLQSFDSFFCTSIRKLYQGMCSSCYSLCCI